MYICKSVKTWKCGKYASGVPNTQTHNFGGKFDYYSDHPILNSPSSNCHHCLTSQNSKMGSKQDIRKKKKHWKKLSFSLPSACRTSTETSEIGSSEEDRLKKEYDLLNRLSQLTSQSVVTKKGKMTQPAPEFMSNQASDGIDNYIRNIQVQKITNSRKEDRQMLNNLIKYLNNKRKHQAQMRDKKMYYIRPIMVSSPRKIKKPAKLSINKPKSSKTKLKVEPKYNKKEEAYLAQNVKRCKEKTKNDDPYYVSTLRCKSASILDIRKTKAQSMEVGSIDQRMKKSHSAKYGGKSNRDGKLDSFLGGMPLHKAEVKHNKLPDGQKRKPTTFIKQYSKNLFRTYS